MTQLIRIALLNGLLRKLLSIFDYPTLKIRCIGCVPRLRPYRLGLVFLNDNAGIVPAEPKGIAQRRPYRFLL